MSNPVNPDLPRRIAKADFRAICDSQLVAASLPEWKRTAMYLGLYEPIFTEYEMALGRRHPDDPRPLHGGLGCMA